MGVVIIAIELAAVYVPITPSLKGAGATIQRELGGVDVSAAGERMGSSVSSGIGRAFKASAIGVGAILATGIAASLVKGFARLDAIDVARAKLTGLGNDAGTVSVVMTDALASVRGTAFGLGDAATVAAQLVAAQIKPGEQLQGVLKSVANSAAAAGTGLDEMGSIYAKVASLGKAQNDVLQQVADRGIPIYQSLATQLGVTADEVFKMASAGEIGFAEFQQAMTSAAGTVADELGNTVGGAWSNFMASLGRIGAGLLGGVFPQIAPSIKGITGALEPLERLSGAIGERVGQFLAPAMANLVGVISGDVRIGWVDQLALSIRAFFAAFQGEGITSDGLVGFFEALGVAARSVVSSGILAFASPFAIVMTVLKDALPIVGAALSDLGSALTDLAASVLPQVAQLLGVVAGVLASALPAILPTVTSLVSTLGGGLAGAISAIAPAIGPLAIGLAAAAASMKIFGAVAAVQAAGGLVAWIASTNLATAAQAAFNLVMNANPIMLIVTAIVALVAGLIYFFTQTELGKAIWAEFTRFLGEAWTNIVNVATTVFTALASFFTTVWTGIVDVVTTVWNAVASFLGPIFEVIATIVRVYVETWINIFKVFVAVFITIWQAVSGVITTVWEAIVSFLTPIITTIVAFVIAYFTTLFNFWSTIWNAVSSFFMGIWNGIIGFIVPIIVNIVNAVRGPIQALQGFWTSVWSGISSFFSGIWSGMVNTVSTAVGSIGNVVGGIFNAVMGAFGNIGNWLVDSGRALIQGFIDGILSMVRAVGDAVNNVISWADGFFPNSPAKRGPWSGSGWAGIRHSGQAVMDQFNLGLGDSSFEDAFSATVGSVSGLSSSSPSLAGSPRSGDTYVQSPWGPEYMRAKTAEVASDVVRGDTGARRRTFNQGVSRG